MKNTNSVYFIIALLVSCFTCPAYANEGKIIRSTVKAATAEKIAVPVGQQISGAAVTSNLAGSSVSHAAVSSAVNSAVSSAAETAAQQVAAQPILIPPVLEDQGVALSDGKGKEKGQHSIVPSAVTVLGSPAIESAQERTITYLRKRAQEESTSEYIPPAERENWRLEFETLRVLWAKAEPSNVEDLPKYLTHQVPDETLSYLQQEYTSLVELIQKTQSEIMPKVVYSTLQNEGKRFDWEEKRHINDAIANVRLKVSVLLKAINKDPYLLVQQKYWDSVLGAFNPLIKGIVAKPGSIFRPDNRQFVFAEFALHNPDGSLPYLPQSDSMIAGESRFEDDEDDFDEDQYSGSAEAMRRKMARRAAEQKHQADMMALAEKERDELIAKLPAGQRIAVLNDDLLPLINFQGWAKKGYLGKDATVTIYRDGVDFMKDIFNGVRYDVVITDLVIKGGGAAMMENFRALDSDAVVFASSKFYPGDGDDHSARDLFNFGMDGYIWNNTNLNEGSYGYLQYLRQLNNYYYYKGQHGWSR